MIQVWMVAIKSVVYRAPSSAAEMMRRSRNSDRDLRNLLNMGSLDVSGYMGESS